MKQALRRVKETRRAIKFFEHNPDYKAELRVLSWLEPIKKGGSNATPFQF